MTYDSEGIYSVVILARSAAQYSPAHFNPSSYPSLASLVWQDCLRASEESVHIPFLRGADEAASSSPIMRSHCVMQTLGGKRLVRVEETR